MLFLTKAKTKGTFSFLEMSIFFYFPFLSSFFYFKNPRLTSFSLLIVSLLRWCDSCLLKFSIVFTSSGDKNRVINEQKNPFALSIVQGMNLDRNQKGYFKFTD